jgi:hypothetical protein
MDDDNSRHTASSIRRFITYALEEIIDFLFAIYRGPSEVAALCGGNNELDDSAIVTFGFAMVGICDLEIVDFSIALTLFRINPKVKAVVTSEKTIARTKC